MPAPTFAFTNSAGRRFIAEVILDTDSVVRFYDASQNRDVFGPLGQFTGGSYYVATILGTDGFGSGTGGLCLQGGQPVWDIDAAAMIEVRAWLTQLMAAGSTPNQEA